ncbi:TlpA disulfide reductase family protein [Sphingobacterium sp. DR205]|uniref:TlpA family protein disulfide reductase n=1 Tax=Sphingobacterium sp. DR205 TaxID=2713573 RepID=UPI0013E4F7BD|nr:TlpA disulfide reductase family protein [Sphingobacterium sp. DR205]QIH31455.1 TlpA family protein disulfide reductase [Sphingobacterium sp. DR205]
MFSNAPAQSQDTLGADAGLTDIKPLQIGDKIPEELWHLPLQIVNHPDGKDTITLNDYRDKEFIILDFWATWCAPCIKELPSLLELKDSIDCKIIPLSDEPTDKIERFLTNNPMFRQSEFYKYERGSIIDKGFKRASIPHTVVIHEGKVISFTLPNLISVKKLADQAAGKSGAIPMKVELKNSKDDLLTLVLDRDKKIGLGGFSVMFGPIEGIVPGVRWEPELQTGGARFQIANYPLLSVMALATGQGHIFLRNPNRILIREKGGIRPINTAEWDWLKHTRLCYESFYPCVQTYEKATEDLKGNLLSYRNIDCRIEDVSSEVTELTRSQKTGHPKTKFCYSVGEIAFVLNQAPGRIPVSYPENLSNEQVYLGIELSSASPDMLDKLLSEQGWSKELITTREKHLIITKKD